MNDLPPILIVDNSDDDVELFRIGLAEAKLGNPVVVCRDGVRALDYLLRRGEHEGVTGPLPQFVLMDMKMPRMDGTEVLAEMRRHDSLRMVPVVMMSSSTHHRDIVAGYAAGANAFVIKPVGFERLMESAKAIGVFWGAFNRAPGTGPGP
jgi:two-component system response regulator